MEFYELLKLKNELENKEKMLSEKDKQLLLELKNLEKIGLLGKMTFGLKSNIKMTLPLARMGFLSAKKVSE